MPRAFRPLLFLALLCRVSAAAPEAVLTRFDDIWALPEVEQHRSHAVSLDYQIYYYDPAWQAVWGRCGNQWGYLSLGSQVFPLNQGDIVRITGRVTPADGMKVEDPTVRLLSAAAPGKPEATAGAVGDVNRFNNHYVTVEGLVDHVTMRDLVHREVLVVSEGRLVWAQVLMHARGIPLPAPNTLARFTGVYFARPQASGAPPRLELWVQSPEAVTVLGDLDRDARFAAAPTAVADLGRAARGARVVVAGTVAGQEDGALLLKDATGCIRVESPQTRTLARGTAVEAFGLPVREASGWALRGGLFRVPLPLMTSVQQFYDLPESARGVWYRVRFEFLVNEYDPGWFALWGRNGGVDSYISMDLKGRRLASGSRILVEGRMRPADGSAVIDPSVTELSPSEPLEPLHPGTAFGEADRFDKHLVEVSAYVDQQTPTDPNHLEVDLDVYGRLAVGRLYLPPGVAAPNFEGDYVLARGVYSATTNPTTGVARIELWLQDPGSLQVRGSIAQDDRFNAPLTSIEQLAAAKPHSLVHVHGVVRAQEPGEGVTIRDETGQTVLRTVQAQPLSIGESIEAIGYAAGQGGSEEVDGALFRRTAHPVVFSAESRLRVAEQVRELRPEEAGRNYPVLLNGVVTWANPAADFFFLSDGSGGIGVFLPPQHPPLMTGMNVRVTGVTSGGQFAPVVLADAVTGGGVAGVPEPRPVTLEQALTGVEEAQWVSMTGFLRQVVREGTWSRLDLTTSAGEFVARLPFNTRFEQLAGSVVTVHGVCDATANARRQLTGVQVWVPSRRYLQVDEPVPADPFALPSRPIAALRQFSSLLSLNRRIHVAGVVVNWPKGGVAQLQDGAETLRVLSRRPLHFQPGDRIDAVGFTGQEDNQPVLRESVCRLIAHGSDLTPLALPGAAPVNVELAGRLVRIEGRVLDLSAQERGIHLLLHSALGLFEATLEAPGQSLPAQWVRGSRVAVTGVYTVQFDEYRRPDGLEVVLRSPADVAVLQRAPWWTEQRMLALAGLLAAALLSGIGWVLALRRRVRQQTTVIHEQVNKEKAARLDAALTRASKLESLGVLAGGIAHDFNNLLTVVMGNLSLAKLDSHVSSETQSLLDQGVEAAKQARGLTQQLLTFAKGGEPVRRSESLVELVREATAFALHGSKSACEFDFSPELWAANVDRTQIGQVIHNIVINADQAMPEGGRIRISLRDRVVAANMVPGLAAGRYVELTLEDTGPGIPAEQLPRIFEPYFTTKSQGNGLGLATVHSIVKRHKGHIAVESSRGQGTTFRIWLPAAESAHTKSVEAPSAPLVQTGRILFMDDEAPIRRVAGAVFERMGWQMTAVDDGEAAVKAYENARAAGCPFDVVILDLTVPGGMGGAAAMVELLRIDPGVKAIASSGYSSDPVMANFKDYGFSAIVPKPYQVSELMKCVSALLRTAPHARRQEVPGLTV